MALGKRFIRGVGAGGVAVGLIGVALGSMAEKSGKRTVKEPEFPRDRREVNLDWAVGTGDVVFVGLKGVGAFKRREASERSSSGRDLVTGGGGQVYPLEVVRVQEAFPSTQTVFRLMVRKPTLSGGGLERENKWDVFWGVADAYNAEMHGSRFIRKEGEEAFDVRVGNVETNHGGRIRRTIPLRRIAETTQSVVLVWGRSIAEVRKAVETVEGDAAAASVYAPVLPEPNVRHTSVTVTVDTATGGKKEE